MGISIRKRWLVLLGGTLLVLVVPLLLIATWLLLIVGHVGWNNYQTRHHQAFAARGMAQIQPALEMAALFPDCRHFITYAGGSSQPIWNSVAYFGDRYELTLQVPVEIKSATQGHMNGPAQFYLNEVSEVRISPTGQIGASFSRGIDFDLSDWTKVAAAGGDFSVIGFQVKPTPVKDFEEFAKANR